MEQVKKPTFLTYLLIFIKPRLAMSRRLVELRVFRHMVDAF